MKLISLAFFVSFFFSVLSCTEDAPRYWDDNTILLNMINKRLEVAPLVAKSKWNTKLPIDDPDREKVILDSVESKAKNLGVDKNFALYFFKAQFEAGKIVQRQLHEKWEIEHQPPFDPVPDLALEVRPILDSLTPLLLMELKK